MTNLQIGDFIQDTEQVADLPVGAVIKDRGGILYYIKAQNGRWAGWFPEQSTGVPASGSWPADSFAMPDYNLVHSLPGGNPPPPPPESWAQWMWRFRINAIRGAVENGIGMGRVNAALIELGIVPDSAEFPLGPDVPVFHEDRIPDGVTVYQGDPDRPEQFALWGRRRGGW